MVRLEVVLTATQVTEEPDEVKVSRPVLEARQGGDSLTLASGVVKSTYLTHRRYSVRCQLFHLSFTPNL